MEKYFYYKIIIAIIGIAGASVILLLISSYRVGVSPDSVYYISVARYISDGTGFVGYDGYNFVLQPPLFPVVLAAIKTFFDVDPLQSTGYLNALLFGIIIYISGLFLLKYLKHFSLIVIGTLLISVSFALIQISLIILSEPLFIVLVLLHLYYFDIYRIQGTVNSLLLFSTAAALACLTRYVGVIIILTGSISIFIWGRKTSKEKFRHLVIFLFITTIPTGLWILRNFILSGTFVGQRAESSYTLSGNITFFFNTVLKWYLPAHLNGMQLFISILIASAVIITAVFLIYKRNLESLKLKRMGPVIIFMIFYSLIIIISSTTTAYDKIGSRLLSPVFVPSVFVMFLILDNILEWSSKHFRQLYMPVYSSIGILVWMIYPTAITINNIEYFAKQSGWEYSSKEWRDNTVIRYLNNHKKYEDGELIYSNVPEAVYILANKEAKWSPAKTFYNSPQRIYTKPGSEMTGDGKNKVCLVWFNSSDRNFLFTIDELKKSSTLVKSVQLKDGTIYTVAKK